jgi:hypothetical protein
MTDIIPTGARYLLVVKVEAGLVLLDKPLPRAKGAKELPPAVPAGTVLYAYSTHMVGGAEYARLVPRPISKVEWCRVRDNDIEYVDVTDLATSGTVLDALAVVIRWIKSL